VSQLNGDRPRDDPAVARVTELGGQQDQDGTEPLATRVDQVP
jgi:hypothetical protein